MKQEKKEETRKEEMESEETAAREMENDEMRHNHIEVQRKRMRACLAAVTAEGEDGLFEFTGSSC